MRIESNTRNNTSVFGSARLLPTTSGSRGFLSLGVFGGLFGVFLGGISGCGQSHPALQASSRTPKKINHCSRKRLFDPESTLDGVRKSLSTQSHRPMRVSSLNDTGKVRSKKKIDFSVSLRLNHEEELDQYLLDLQNPHHPNYRHYLTPEEFQGKYGPTQEQVNQVKSYLDSKGIQTVSVSPSKRMIHAQASVREINSAFSTELRNYVSPKQGKKYFAPASELKIPTNLPIQGVHGLQDVTQARTFHQHAQSAAKSPIQPKDGWNEGPDEGMTPEQIKKAYSLPRGLDGSGQTLALFQLDGYNEEDVTHFEQTFGLPNVPLENIYVDGVTGEPSGTAGEDEVNLDLELMISIAPAAKKILIYEGPNSEQGLLNTYERIATENRAKVVSSSWGVNELDATESMLEAENSIFKQMAAQGQSIYAAAGDDGARDNGVDLSVNDPAGQPYVTAVGGTQLATDDDGSHASETTWNQAPNSAGGGGISAYWKRPSWQSQIASENNWGSSTMRNVPDVSLNSDPATGYAIYTRGRWAVIGGTSAASPLWAAFTALVNQKRESLHLASLGFASPIFYQIGQSQSYKNDFYDINDGSTNRHYPAISGYDLATGWGSLKGDNLLQDLVEDSKFYIAPTTTPHETTSGSEIDCDDSQ